MRTRAFTIYLVLAALALFAIGFALDARAAQPTWSDRFDKARYRTHEWQTDEFNRFELQLTVHAAAVHFGASEGYMICVIDRESGWNEKAQNPTSSAAGLFQFVEGTWDAVLPRYRAAVSRPALAVKAGVSRMNARASSLVAAWLIGHGQTFHWGDCS